MSARGQNIREGTENLYTKFETVHRIEVEIIVHILSQLATAATLCHTLGKMPGA